MARPVIAAVIVGVAIGLLVVVAFWAVMRWDENR
jgi:hypothetical protein